MDAYPKILSNTTVLTVLIIAGIFAVLAIIVTIVTIFSKRKASKFDYDEFVEALGKIENIEEVEAKNSRLNVVVNDKKDLDKEKLQDLGASAIIITSKKVTLIMGRKSKEIALHIKKEMKK